MRNLPVLTRREIHTMFVSPTAFVVLTLFLLISGISFYMAVETQGRASMGFMFGIFAWLILAMAPLLTMRLLSEEYHSGTIESLMTSPVTDIEVVLGKFFGTAVFFLAILLATLVYPLILRVLGKPDLGRIASAYFGLFLMGCQFIALGLFFSAVTRYQLIAGAATFVVLSLVWLLNMVGSAVSGTLGELVRYASTYQHIRTLVSGRIVFRDLFYFVSLICFWLFLAVQALKSRRWR